MLNTSQKIFKKKDFEKKKKEKKSDTTETMQRKLFDKINKINFYAERTLSLTKEI